MAITDKFQSKGETERVLSNIRSFGQQEARDTEMVSPQEIENKYDKNYFINQANKQKEKLDILKDQKKLVGEELKLFQINERGKELGMSSESIRLAQQKYTKSRQHLTDQYYKELKRKTDEYGVINGIADFGIGFGKRAMETVSGMSELGQRFLRTVTGAIIPSLKETKLSTIPEEVTKREGFMQEAGGFAESIAEFFVPAGKVTKSKAFVEGTVKGLTKPGVLRWLGNVVGKGVVEGITDTAILQLNKGKIDLKDLPTELGASTLLGTTFEGLAPVAGWGRKLFFPKSKETMMKALNPGVNKSKTLLNSLDDVMHTLVSDTGDSLGKNPKAIIGLIKEKGLSALPEILQDTQPKQIEGIWDLIEAVGKKKGQVYQVLKETLGKGSDIMVKGDDLINRVVDKVSIADEILKQIGIKDSAGLKKRIIGTLEGFTNDVDLLSAERLRAKAGAAASAAFKDTNFKGDFGATESQLIYTKAAEVLEEMINESLDSVGAKSASPIRKAYSKLASVYEASYSAALKSMGKSNISLSDAMNAPSIFARIASGNVIGGTAQGLSTLMMKSMKNLDTMVSKSFQSAKKEYGKKGVGALIKSPFKAISDRFGSQLDGGITSGKGIGLIEDVLKPTADDIAIAVAKKKPLMEVIEERVMSIVDDVKPIETPSSFIDEAMNLRKTTQADSIIKEANKFSKFFNSLSDTKKRELIKQPWIINKINNLEGAGADLTSVRNFQSRFNRNLNKIGDDLTGKVGIGKVRGGTRKSKPFEEMFQDIKEAKIGFKKKK